MSSADFLNYALGSSAVVTAFGTFVIGILNYRKSSKIEAHTNGMVDVLTRQAASTGRASERLENVARGGTTGTKDRKP